MQTCHLYIASCSPQGGILHGLLEGGRFTLLDTLPCDRPMYMDLEGDTLHIILREPFASSRESGLMDCTLRSDHSLGRSGPVQSTLGQCGCHLCHAQGHVYVTNYLSGSVFSTSGTLHVHQGRGPNAERQEMPHTHYIHPSPDGRFLFSTDLGLDTIFIYDHALRVHGTARVPSGHGCRHLAFSRDGSTVFCANELECTVSVFSYGTGTLVCLGTFATLPSPLPGNTSAAIRTEGDHVYVSQRGADAISSLVWDAGERQLRLESVIPCGGASPRDFIVLDGCFLCTNEKSDSVTLISPSGEGWQAQTILHTDAPLCILARNM